MFDQRLRHRSGSGPQLDHRTGKLRLDVARHGARQNSARRRHRAGRERPLEQGADEMNLVVEAKRLSCGDPKRLRAHDHRTQERRGPFALQATVTGRTGLAPGQAPPPPPPSPPPPPPPPPPPTKSSSPPHT